jgi:hypothetical protein
MKTQLHLCPWGTFVLLGESDPNELVQVVASISTQSTAKGRDRTAVHVLRSGEIKYYPSKEFVTLVHVDHQVSFVQSTRPTHG